MSGESIKYGVESLSQQWMIHALLLSDEKFNINKVDLSLSQNEQYKPFQKQLDIFQSNYHFDSSPEKNIELFLNYCIKNNLNANFEQLKIFDFANEFLSANKEIQQRFSDAWIYKSVLSIKEPDKYEDITNDLVDLVRFQTAIPKKKIKKVFTDVLAFKKKYGISHVIQHESHVNGPWEGDMKGDIAFEDKLTLSLLAQRYYDPYNHNINLAIKKFNEFALKARFSFEKTDTLSANMAYDSYSFRQAILYERDSKTKLIEKIQQKETDVGNTEKENIILLKLDNDVLTPSSFIQAIVKKDVSLTRENIVEDSKKLSFLLANQQLINSISVGDLGTESTELLKPILESNYEQCVQIKKELSEHYRFMAFEKLNDDSTKFLDLVWNVLFGNDSKSQKMRDDPKLIEKVQSKFKSMGRFEFSLVEKIFNKCVESANKNISTEIDSGRLLVANLVMRTMSECVNSRNIPLERALIDTTAQFIHTREILLSDETEDEGKDGKKKKKKEKEKLEIKSVADMDFLPQVNINRQNPIKHLLVDFNKYRLVNNFIEYNINTFKEDISVNNKKKKTL
jgi:hypothetical protein